MNDTEEPNDWDYGFYSNHWILKAALMYVPRSQLNLAIVSLIDEMVYGQDEEIDYLDLLAQVAFTGRYVKTREHDPSDHDRDPRTKVLSQADIDRQVAEFQEFLATLAPTAPEEGADSDE